MENASPSLNSRPRGQSQPKLRPHVESISSTRFDTDEGSPSNPLDFCEWIDLEIGATQDGRVYGGEAFAVRVCTPGWLTAQLALQPGIWGRSLLIVDRWDNAVVRSRVQELCDAVDATDWASVVNALARYLIVDTIDFRPDEV